MVVLVVVREEEKEKEDEERATATEVCFQKYYSTVATSTGLCWRIIF